MGYFELIVVNGNIFVELIDDLYSIFGKLLVSVLSLVEGYFVCGFYLIFVDGYQFIGLIILSIIVIFYNCVIDGGVKFLYELIGYGMYIIFEKGNFYRMVNYSVLVVERNGEFVFVNKFFCVCFLFFFGILREFM